MTHSSKIITPLLALLLPVSLQALEPLVDSTPSAMAAKARQLIDKADKDGDSKIQKSEDEKVWKKNARFDEDADGSLSLEELAHGLNRHIDSPGKKFLNVLYKKTEQGDLHLDFYFPDEDNSTKKPVVVFTHGGGWATGDKSKAGEHSFNKVHRALLKEGFCVLSVGYRLIKKDGDSAMRDCVIDCKDALRFISGHQKELGIDPDRIYTFGDSAGGHLAQMLLFSPPESLPGDAALAEYSYQTVAGVSWYGPCDFQDPQLFNHNDRANFRDRFGARIMSKGTPKEDKGARYREMSPVSYLTEKSAPLLMIQGDKDTTIPVKQAYRMQAVSYTHLTLPTKRIV